MDKPWYYECENLLIEATEIFLGGVERAPSIDDGFNAFVSDLLKEFYAKFIFESNNIEGEGLSEGETKKLILAEFKEKDLANLEKNIRYSSFDVFKVNKKQNEVELPKLGISVKYQNSEKEFYAVLGHLISILKTDRDSYQILHDKFDLADKMFGELSDAQGKEMLTRPRYFQLIAACSRYNVWFQVISEKFLKEIHKNISLNSDNNNNGQPGEYRPSPAYINGETIFLEPSLIPSAMNRFVKGHIERISKGSFNSIIEACRIKEEFIKIHPFGDFNGRLSRLILSGFLRSEGYPYHTILRSNSKDKSRYFTSMKHAFRGNPLPLIALVSKTIIEQANSVNTRLEFAGFKKVSPIKLNSYGKKLIREQIAQYKSECKNMALK